MNKQELTVEKEPLYEVIIGDLYLIKKFNRIRQKSPILYRWVMNAVRYEGYRW